MQHFIRQRDRKISALALAITSLIGVSVAPKAFAVPVTYTFTTIGSGTFDGSAFNNATVIITATSDTSGIGSFTFPGGTSPVLYSVGNLETSVFVSGLGTDDFAIAGSTYLAPPNNVVGIEIGSGDVIDMKDVGAFTGYALATDIGPLSGATIIQPSGNLFGTFATDGMAGVPGTFSFSAIGTVSFQSDVPSLDLAVPENTSTLGLLFLGLAGLAGNYWIQRVRAVRQAD